jgi:Leucine-rich repeat (LRR) protein
MLTTFDNAEKQHLRRKELERHIQIIASAGATSDLELYSDNPDLTAAADNVTGKPLNKAATSQEDVVIIQRRPRRPVIILVVAILVVITVLWSVVNSSLHSPYPTEIKVDEVNTRYRRIFSLILDLQVTSRSTLEDKGSAQARALDWLANQDAATEIEDVRTRYSLATLYFSTHTNSTWSNTKNWLSADQVCVWYGVTCNPNKAKVTIVQELNLSANGLMGTLPEELSLLQRDCHVLDLSANAIGGAIPETMGQSLKNLKRLYLGPNVFASTIPETLYELSHLTHLYIDSSQLVGTLSPSIKKLTSLHGLGLHNNDLTGSIPSTIGDLTELRVLNLDENHFNSSIPSSLGAMVGLVDLRLSQNSLIGAIPPQLENLMILEILYLDQNSLTGSIPDGLSGRLPFLSELHLYNNFLTGRVPSALGFPPFLQALYLDGNDFTGSMPKSICDRRDEGVLHDLWADCGEPVEIECSLDSCCTHCLPEVP